MKILIILLILFFVLDLLTGLWCSHMEVKREIEIERKLDIIENYIFEPFQDMDNQKKRYIPPTTKRYKREQTHGNEIDDGRV